MARVLVYYAHPGHQVSRANKQMFAAAGQVADITLVDLYAQYPRFDIDVDEEQARLLRHDVVIFQCPVFWYSTPAIIKEWQDLVLEQGFAYGHEGEALAGKTMLLALTAAGPQSAYDAAGYQHYDLRTFLTPLEQTARLCHMHFAAPYVLFDSLKDENDETEHVDRHVHGYVQLLGAIRDGRYNFARSHELGIVLSDNLPIAEALAAGDRGG